MKRLQKKVSNNPKVEIVDFTDITTIFEENLPEIFKPFDLNDFIAKQCYRVIDGGMITKSAVLYEFIDRNGKLKYSVIHENELTMEEAVELIVNVYGKFLSGDMKPDEDE